jgi:hypothetical protein
MEQAVSQTQRLQASSSVHGHAGARPFAEQISMLIAQRALARMRPNGDQAQERV